MSAELGTTDDPRALVPGDPAAVAADARALADRAAGLVRTAGALRRIGTGSWTGPAADAWRDRHDTEVPRWLQGADSLDSAADALHGHAGTLGRAQDAAARAITLWRSGDAATARARADHDRAVAAGAVPPAFTDPGDEPRRAARDLLARARDELRRSGDQVAAVLRGEAGLAPRDSQKQSDADFLGGIRDSVVAAGKGAWTLLSDPASAVAGVVAAAAHPADAAKDAIAWNDWTEGREPRALGRNTGDMVVGIATLGAGKITSALGRGARIADEPRPPGAEVREAVPTPVAAATPAARADAVRNVVLNDRGDPHGREDSKGIYLIDEASLQDMRRRLRSDLGEPEVTRTEKGERETWQIGSNPRAFATYRSYSSSGGATIDVTGIDGLPVRRFHIDEGG